MHTQTHHRQPAEAKGFTSAPPSASRWPRPVWFEVLPLDKLLATAHVAGLSGEAVRLRRRGQDKLVTGGVGEGTLSRGTTAEVEHQVVFTLVGLMIVCVRNWRFTPT